jgi:hypothetical protein
VSFPRDQEMTYGRSLQRHLNHFDLPMKFTEWARLEQDRRAWWHMPVTWVVGSFVMVFWCSGGKWV